MDKQTMGWVVSEAPPSSVSPSAWPVTPYGLTLPDVRSEFGLSEMLVTGCAAMVPRGSTLTIHVVPDGSAGSIAETLIIRGWADVLARYQAPGSDSPSQFDVSSGEQLDGLLARAADHVGGRGIPAVELMSDDGSTLVIGQTRLGAVLLWIDAQGESRHSVGSGSTEDLVVFDYFGSYTEVPSEFVVPSDVGRAAALAFLNGESPAVSGLALDPD